MFSEKYYEEIRAGFERQMSLLKERNVNLDQIREVFEGCTREEAQALTFLYGAMPLSDLLDYPPQLFLAYARHGVFLWEHGPFAGRVPEKLFANYVLCHRVNNEDLEDVRGFFYDKLTKSGGWKELSGRNAFGSGKGDMYEAVKEVNYWCAGEASYCATDERTQNPHTVLKAARGRCGEESVLAVTALRSIGIPARQVYVPLWSHCDDNHAWVEAWCDGEWHYLGACEPQERLDRGWFTGPASRAMLVHSRWFGADGLPVGDITAGRSGMARMLNHLKSYASVRELLVKAVDEDGTPVPGARIELQILNQGRFRPIAVLRADTGQEGCGTVRFLTGRGDLWISACAEGVYGEGLVSLCDGQDGVKEYVLVLKREPKCGEKWEELDFHAPAGGTVPEEKLTKQEQLREAERLEAAEERRRHKLESFLEEKELDGVLEGFAREDQQALKEILQKAGGNAGELVSFLNRGMEGSARKGESEGEDSGKKKPQGSLSWKRKLLETLREKDLWDIRSQVLEDCWGNSRLYESSLPEEIFFPYVACPRVDNEMLRPCRRELLQLVSVRDQEQIRKDPGCLPGLAKAWIRSLPEQEYEGLITSPTGCLRGGMGSRASRNIFCVTLYRSLGIPARQNPLDGQPEYWQNGQWAHAGEKKQDACLVLRWAEGLEADDTDHYSLERFEEGSFRYLNLKDYWRQQGRKKEENRGESGEAVLTLDPGIYRITTAVRRRNGDQLARMLVFRLREGQRREAVLSLRQIPPEDMLIHARAEETVFCTPEGEQILLSGLAGAEEPKGGDAGPALLLWLALGREPTEHILNELYELSERFRALPASLYIVVKNQEELNNSTLARTRKAIPKIRVLLEESEEKAWKLAESVGQEPEKLPLALILKAGQECVYSAAGYRAGQGALLWRVLQWGWKDNFEGSLPI